MSETSGARFAERLRRKRALLEAGDPAHEEIRTLLFMTGGGMRGVYGAGACLGLHHLGFADCFDYLFGVSVGIITGAYFVAGKKGARRGATIFFEECRTGFIDGSLFSPTLNIDYLEAVLRDGPKKLDLATLTAHRSTLLASVTEWRTGKNTLVDVKRAEPDPIAAIKASLALTFAYKTPVVVNGEEYTDGGISNPFPFGKAVVKGGLPTDILVVSNYSRRETRWMGISPIEKIATEILATRVPPLLRPAFKERNRRGREDLGYAERNPLGTTFLWADSGVSILTTNLATLKKGMRKGIRDTLTLFGDTETPPESLMP